MAVPKREGKQLPSKTNHAHYGGERMSRRSRNLELRIDYDRC